MSERNPDFWTCLGCGKQAEYINKGTPCKCPPGVAAIWEAEPTEAELENARLRAEIAELRARLDGPKDLVIEEHRSHLQAAAEIRRPDGYYLCRAWRRRDQTMGIQPRDAWTNSREVAEQVIGGIRAAMAWMEQDLQKPLPEPPKEPT